MVALVIVLVIVIAGLAAALFLLGFRVGGEHWQEEVARVRLEAAHAERQLHDLTRQAFVAMSEHVDRRKP
jgi:hypothetical protein